ncbi:pentapeptide repeat-containing protein [Micromonospora sp. WMMD730]|uniref:pentapeptide repeat-containing protein n=1 Tax=Micromonospora sp. WMMD730 TaxID=3404128 RepID=UPI003B93F552
MLVVGGATLFAAAVLVDARAWHWTIWQTMWTVASGHVVLLAAGVPALILLAAGAWSHRPFHVARGEEDKPAVQFPWLLSNRGVLASAVLVAVIGAALLGTMLAIAAGEAGIERARLQIEALKYGLGFFAAAGAVAALLLGVRRQMLAEHTHQLALETQRLSERTHQLALKAQKHTETDAAERRVTELYTKAVEQLGHSDAAVRLGGLYALERVGQNDQGRQQTVVNVLCAYLRMPYDDAPTHEGDQSGSDSPEDLSRRQLALGELQVRLTAQRILARHLRRTENPDDQKHHPSFWEHMHLDLRGATLLAFGINDADVIRADFRRCTLLGGFWCQGARFREGARFDNATFKGIARLQEAKFGSGTSFIGTTFNETTRFDKAIFQASVSFTGATFEKIARFSRVQFAAAARFPSAKFVRRVELKGSTILNQDPTNRSILPSGWKLVHGTPLSQIRPSTALHPASGAPKPEGANDEVSNSDAG